MAGFGHVRSEVFDRVSRSQYYRDNLAGLTAHQRHQRLLSELNRGGAQQDEAAAALASTVTDEDVLRQHHRFLRTAADDALEDPRDWGVRLAKRYYARLYKEYAIADLSRYKEFKVGMRWRTKGEVISGKGQFICGAKGCDDTAGLASYEVNFAYTEGGHMKQALVKLRLCEACAAKLNYRKDKQYKKLTNAATEQHTTAKQAHSDKKTDLQHAYKDEKRDRHKKRSRESEAQAGDSSKRRQRHMDGRDGDEQHEKVREDQLPAALGVDGSAGREINDADIDAWLDGLFAC